MYLNYYLPDLLVHRRLNNYPRVHAYTLAQNRDTKPRICKVSKHYFFKFSSESTRQTTLKNRSMGVEIFEIRPCEFFKLNFVGNAWAENFCGLQIRIQRKISRRMVCVCMGSLVILPTIRTNIVIAWALNVIFS